MSRRKLCSTDQVPFLLGAGTQEALQLAQDLGDADHIGNAYATLGLIAQARGDLDAAAAAFAASATHAESAAPGNLRHLALTNLAEIAWARGDFAGAEDLLTQALAAARAVGNTLEAAMIITLLGHTARQRGYYAQARSHYYEGLARFSEFGSPTFLAWRLEGLAATLAAESDATHAVRFYSAAATLRQCAGTPAPPQERAEIEQTLGDVHARLGDPVFRAEWASAAALPPDRLVAEALAVAAEPQDTTRMRRQQM
ncbi:MAG TPA: tetratricopeptide repeat protein [Ktedonobacterales bacterium]